MSKRKLQPIKLPAAVNVYQTINPGSTILTTPSTTTLGKDAIVYFARVEAVMLLRHGRLALRCQEGGVPYYLLLSDFGDAGDLARKISKQWSEAQGSTEIARRLIRTAENLVLQHRERPQRPEHGAHLKVIK